MKSPAEKRFVGKGIILPVPANTTIITISMRPKLHHFRTPLMMTLVYLPLFALIATLKVIRGIELGSIDSLYSTIVYLLTDFSLFLLLASVFFTLLCIQRRRLLKWTSLVFLYGLTSTVVLIELLSHELFIQTGLFLNWSLLQFGAERIAVVLKITEQQASFQSMAMLAVTLLYFVCTPIWVARQITKCTIEKQVATGISVTVTFLAIYCALLTYSEQFKLPSEEFQGGFGHFITSILTTKNIAESPASTSATQFPVEDPPHIQGNIGNPINVAIIILESTRERSVSPYVDNEVTPYFKQLAANSLLMKNAYSTSPHTSRALFSILCGRFPKAGNAIAETMENGISQPCLPDLLNQQEYDSAFFQSATEDFERRAQLTQNMGFEEFFPLERLDTKGYEKSNYFGYEDNIMLPASQRWLETRKQPFLATYLTVTPHFYYNPISRYGWEKYVNNNQYNAYLNTLHYQDRFLENLIQQYKDLGLYTNTLFVILGDHGEGFREHKLFGHGNIVYEEGVKIPFLLHLGGQLKGTVDSRVSLLDVVPSVLGQLGYEGNQNWFAGSNLLDPIGQRDILLECVSPRQCSALIDAETGFKLIHNYQRTADKLFNILTDPLEQIDLAGKPQHQELEQRMLSRLQQQISSVSAGTNSPTSSGWSYHQQPVTWRNSLKTELAETPEPASISPAIGDKSAELLQLTSSKQHLYAGDSVNLTFVMRNPKKPICIQSQLEGVVRHQRRTRSIELNETDTYIQFNENLQISPEASNITIDVLTKSDCSSEGAVLSRNQATIALNAMPDADLIFSKNSYQVMRQQALPQDDNSSLANTIFLNDLLESSVPVADIIGAGQSILLSGEFLQNIREKIKALEDSYGEFQNLRLESIWQSTNNTNSYIYRYQAFFSKHRSMDIRLQVTDSTIEKLYYYHPWKQGRPL